MKIGIVTWFRHQNYGTILQALALQKYLRSNVNDVQLLNFQLLDGVRIKNTDGMRLFEKFYYYFGRVIYHIIKKTNYNFFEKKSLKLKKVIDDNCVLTEHIVDNDNYVSICNSFDCLFFGSDQIWNPNWYHPFYFGNVTGIKTKLVAYAPSFGVENIPKDLENTYKCALEKFSYISSREESGKKIVEKYTDLTSEVVVDPTMLLSKREWEYFEETINIKPKKYILCYLLSDNYNHWKAIKKYAKKNMLDIVIIPQGGYSFIKSKNVIKDCSVGNFLHLIRNAEIVITDSFHACIFSIIYNKQFLVFERKNPNDKRSQNSRIYNLLDTYELNDCLIKYNSKVIINKADINYTIINNKLCKKIQESKDFIKKIIVSLK